MATQTQNNLCDVPGILVGSAGDEAAKTGVTVILPEAPAVAAVDVRGGGPGTRESDALRPEALVDTVDAIVLSGGSVYGLGAADRVAALLGARGRGFSLMPKEGVPVSPIVPAAILYDLANGGDKSWGERPPYAGLGEAALRSASRDVALGREGAGLGATAGGHPGGLGSASHLLAGGGVVAALAAVNSFGSPFVPGTDRFWAAPYEQNGEFGGRGTSEVTGVHGMPPDTKLGTGARQNTTLAVIATDMALTRVQAQRVAIMAQDGFARALRPVHAPTDGDVVFCLSTGARAMPEPSALSLTEIGLVAADTLTRAIARGVYLAMAAEGEE